MIGRTDTGIKDYPVIGRTDTGIKDYPVIGRTGSRLPIIGGTGPCFGDDPVTEE